MKIGFDGKRAYQNRTGLGNYIRSLVSILTAEYPQHEYTLFAPKKTALFDAAAYPNVHAVFPDSVAGNIFRGWWRRRAIVSAIKKSRVDIYHGVSNELPVHINRAGVKSVVTVHDIIFERFPETYHLDERISYRYKIKRACRVADAVIAISRQTRDDLINIYRVKPAKIFVCYQSCNPIFHRRCSNDDKDTVRNRYQLPDRYFLFVSSIAPRKNLLMVCKALVALKDQLQIPLVVIGDGKKEKVVAKAYMEANGLSGSLLLLNELPEAGEPSFTTAADFPAIYQQALALVYPSLFEGFGAPLLEALVSGLPVISSNSSSLPEVGGDAALYFSPGDIGALAQHMQRIATDMSLVEMLRQKGYEQAAAFTPEKAAASIMAVYENLLHPLP